MRAGYEWMKVVIMGITMVFLTAGKSEETI